MNLDAYRSTCTRAIHWHGHRSVQQMLSEFDSAAGADRYGAGGVVAALEDEICKLLGKPAAVFMPSGTMAQQIALRVHADRRGVRSIAFHPTAHIEIHEEKAYEHLHRLRGVQAGNARELLTIKDLESIREPLAAVLFELPQREIGGRLPEWDALGEQVAFVRKSGAAVHLDGARLWEAAPYYGRTHAEIAALFDTVYVSFYKGLGALAGACLAGEEDVIAEARLWRKRHGGTLFTLWPNAASALGALHKRLPLMPRYFERTREIARELRGSRNIEIVPDPPQTPMMHLHLRVSEQRFLDNALKIAKEEDIFTFARSAPSDNPAVRIAEFTTGDATMQFEASEVADLIRRLVA